MTIDIHTHLGSDRMKPEKVNENNLTENVDTLIERMDKFGIKQAVLVPVQPGFLTELYLQAAAIYPDRLVSACAIWPRPIENARTQIREMVDQEASALVLDSRMYYPEDPAVMALIYAAVQHELPIFFHTSNIDNKTVNLIEMVTETYPEGRFVILHLGGLFGFPRLGPLYYRENLWFEISSTIIKLIESPLRVFLDAIVQDRGVNRLVFGSDHYTDYPELRVVLNELRLNVETLKLVTEKNARTILGNR